MPKKRPKKQEDYQQIARRILDTVVPDAEPKKKQSKSVKGRRKGNGNRG